MDEILYYLEDKCEKRTVLRDFDRIEKEKGIRINRSERRGRLTLYRYQDVTQSIIPINESNQEWAQNLLSLFERIESNVVYDWMRFFIEEAMFNSNSHTGPVVSFDVNMDYVGNQHVMRLARAIRSNEPLRIDYRPFLNTLRTLYVYPYHLKESNKRWFLLCKTNGYDNLSIYALDRIMDIKDWAVPFVRNDIDFADYFDDVIGVTVPDTPVEKVILRVTRKRYNYIKTKPLHFSQTELHTESNERFACISLNVKINKELIAELARLGADVEVLSPISLRQKMIELSEQLYKQYHPDK